MAKSHKSAVVLIPPDRCWANIQRIRRKHDKAYHRWMPHINLLYPFYEFSEFEDAKVRMQRALAEFQPFTVSFTDESFGKFDLGKNATIWLRPVVKKMKAKQPKSQVIKQPPVPRCKHHQDPIHYPSPMPVTGTSSVGSTGLDALRNAFWEPGKDTDATSAAPKSTEPSLDNLRYAFVGLDVKPNNESKQVTNAKSNYADGERIVGQKHVENKIKSNDNHISNVTEENLDDFEPVAYKKSLTINNSKPDCDVGNDLEEGCDLVVKLQSILQQEFPDCDDLEKISSKGFQPHLTLGQCPVDNAQDFIRDLQDSWQDMTFNVTEICLIHRSGDPGDQFEVDFHIPIGDSKEDNNPNDFNHHKDWQVTPDLGYKDVASHTPANHPQTWPRENIPISPDDRTGEEAPVTSKSVTKPKRPPIPRYPLPRPPNIKSKAEFPALGDGRARSCLPGFEPPPPPPGQGKKKGKKKTDVKS